MRRSHVLAGARKALGLLVSAALALSLAGVAGLAPGARQIAYAEEALGCTGKDHNPGFTVTSEDGTKAFSATHIANGYTYYDWAADSDKSVCLYTVKVPQGTKTVTITAEKESLFYNYQNGEYLDGWVDDATVGSVSVTLPTDSNSDGVLDCIQVQDTYNPDWTGGALRYALSFQEVPQVEPAVNVEQLICNLSARFSTGGANESIDNSTWAAALALNALGKDESINAKATLAVLAEEDLDKMGAGTLAKFIMVLTSANVDCTEVTLEGKEYDLIQLLKNKVKEQVDVKGYAIDEWSAPCIVPVFGCCGYDATGFEPYVDRMITTMVSKVPSLYEGWGSIDVMSTSQAILALQPYAQNDEAVAAALNTAKTNLLAQLQEDGSFPTGWGNGVDDTALAYAALKTLGVSDQEMYTTGGSNPITYLASRANGTLTGFAISGNEALSASSALLGFAASKVEGNVYKAQKPVTVVNPDAPAVTPDPKPAPVSLKSVYVYSATKAYNGTYQAIKVKVTGKNGKTLVKNRDYTMSRSSVKYVGTYGVKITGKGSYKGSITKYVKVNPAKESMYYAKAGKKRALVRATKSAAKCGATKIQFAYKKVGATKWSYKTTTSSKTYLKKLSKGKKYYVKVRAIKTVNGKTYYGAWSTCKKTARIK